MTKETRTKWEMHEFSSGGYAGKDYISFQKSMRADLKKQLERKGLMLHSFHKNHYCFSAVVTDGIQFAYVSMSDVRGEGTRLFKNVLYRTMEHDKDWRGGYNNYCDWEDLAENICRLFGLEQVKTSRYEQERKSA